MRTSSIGKHFENEKRKREKSDRWKNSSQDRNNRRVIRSMQRDRASVGARKRWLCFEPEPLVHAFVAAREPTDDLNGAKRRASVGRQHNQLPLRSDERVFQAAAFDSCQILFSQKSAARNGGVVTPPRPHASCFSSIAASGKIYLSRSKNRMCPAAVGHTRWTVEKAPFFRSVTDRRESLEAR